MRCEEVKNELVAYLDGEIPAEERERIDSHLANCPACRAEMVDFQSTDDLLGVLFAPTKADLGDTASRDLAKEVLAEAKEDPWCRHIRREIVAMLDGELSGKEKRPVVEHLAECGDCRAERDGLAGTGDLLSRWTFPAIETDLVPLVVPKRPRGVLRRLVPALAAACVLVIATLGVLTNSGSDPELAPLEELAVRHGVGPDLLADPDILELAEDLEWVEELGEFAMLSGNGG